MTGLGGYIKAQLIIIGVKIGIADGYGVAGMEGGKVADINGPILIRRSGDGDLRDLLLRSVAHDVPDAILLCLFAVRYTLELGAVDVRAVTLLEGDRELVVKASVIIAVRAQPHERIIDLARLKGIVLRQFFEASDAAYAGDLMPFIGFRGSRQSD